MGSFPTVSKNSPGGFVGFLYKLLGEWSKLTCSSCFSTLIQFTSFTSFPPWLWKIRNNTGSPFTAFLKNGWVEYKCTPVPTRTDCKSLCKTMDMTVMVFAFAGWQSYSITSLWRHSSFLEMILIRYQFRCGCHHGAPDTTQFPWENAATIGEMASCISPPVTLRGGRNELTTDTAHARVGTVVHTQLVGSSLWKKRQDCQAQLRKNRGKKFNFYNLSKKTIKQVSLKAAQGSRERAEK